MPVKSFVLLSVLSLLPVLGVAQGDAYALQRILQRYTEVYGGFRDADALSSLSVEGTIEQNGQTFDFLMRKKRPTAFRYRLSNGPNSVISGYSGSRGWMRTESNGEVTIKDLKGEALYALREQARFEGPLFRHLEKGENQLELVERISRDDVHLYVIEVDAMGAGVSRYYLDGKTALIVQHDRLNAAGEVIFQTFYRDYKEVDGYPFAHEIENLANGQRVSLAKVERIEVNPGLLSFYFEKPRR